MPLGMPSFLPLHGVGTNGYLLVDSHSTKLAHTMNLCIDQGNSRTKIALFDQNGRMARTFMYRTFSYVELEKLFSLYPISDSIISSVGNVEPSVVNCLARKSRFFVLLDHHTRLPIDNLYDTPHTLGQDRLAAAVGAVTLCPNTNLLIIDAGSAITYDYVSQEGQYMGGNIAPGIKMRLTVLKTMTKRLPLVEVEENQLFPLFGRNTKDAIASGVIRGVVYEVKGYMKTLSERVEHFETFLTGGSAPYILNNMQQDLNYQRHLTLIGLNRILVYNKEKQ